MAVLHRAAFTLDRGWSADEFTSLMHSPFVDVFTLSHGFALTRTIAGESELLTLAVDPAQQRKGIARQLLHNWIAAISDTTESAFLEVAADNVPALALYYSAEFNKVAMRPNYYVRKNAENADALILKRDLRHEQSIEYCPVSPKSG